MTGGRFTNKDSSKWKGYGKTWKTKKLDVWLSFKVSLPFLTSSTFAAGLKHLKKMLQVCPRPWKDGDDAGYGSLLCLGFQSYQPATNLLPPLESWRAEGIWGDFSTFFVAKMLRQFFLFGLLAGKNAMSSHQNGDWCVWRKGRFWETFRKHGRSM